MAWRKDHSLALDIALWLRAALKNEEGEDKTAHACDILEEAQWIISGPGWSRGNTRQQLAGPNVYLFPGSKTDGTA